jgi:hypothetical protein
VSGKLQSRGEGKPSIGKEDEISVSEKVGRGKVCGETTLKAPALPSQEKSYDA